MKTVGIDTNVLLTYRLQREPGFKKANDLFKDCVEGTIQIFLPSAVILETEWTLRSNYKQSREQVITFFKELLHIDALIIKDKSDIEHALSLYEVSSGVGFTDCFILVQIQDNGADSFLTFDEKLKKFYQKNFDN